MIGSSILKALLETERYVVTVLTRSASAHHFPSTVIVVEVDYSSLDSLMGALRGQGVLISALPKAALGNELLLMDAAALQNVQKVIPSEFGSDLLNPHTRLFPNYRDKVLVQERLKMHSCRAGSNMTYTLVFNNVLLDWSLSSGFILDPRQRIMHRYDDGDTLFSTTRVSTVGHAVAGILENLETTANRAVYIQDMAVTQNELLCIINSEIESLLHKTSSTQPPELETISAKGLVQRSLPSGSNPQSLHPTWRLVEIDTVKAEKEAMEEIASGAPPSKLFYSFAARAAFVEGYGGHFKDIDNGILGLEGLSEEGLRTVIREALSKGAK
jgi:hypothetical protein